MSKNYKRKDAAPKTGDKPPREKGEVYGFLLNARAVAGAACNKVPPTAMRVAAFIAQHLDQKGECRVGQETIAAALGISRQAVNRAIKTLVRLGIIKTTPRAHGPLKYIFLTDEYRHKFAGHEAVKRLHKLKDARRAEKNGEAPREADEQKPAATGRRGTMLGDAECMADNIKVGFAVGEVNERLEEAINELCSADYSTATQAEIAAVEKTVATMRADAKAQQDELWAGFLARWPNAFDDDKGAGR